MQSFLLLLENTAFMFYSFLGGQDGLFLEITEDFLSLSLLLRPVRSLIGHAGGHVPTWESLKLCSCAVLTCPHDWRVRGGENHEQRQQGWVLERIKKGCLPHRHLTLGYKNF